MKDKYAEYKKLFKIKTSHGYLTWRYGTNANIEIFNIEVKVKRMGYGTELVKLLLEKCESIFMVTSEKMIYGFTKEENIEAKLFYTAIGLNLIKGIDNNCIFWQTIPKLYEKITRQK